MASPGLVELAEGTAGPAGGKPVESGAVLSPPPDGAVAVRELNRIMIAISTTTIALMAAIAIDRPVFDARGSVGGVRDSSEALGNVAGGREAMSRMASTMRGNSGSFAGLSHFTSRAV